jgi:Mg-chelatase subunit ChlD
MSDNSLVRSNLELGLELGSLKALVRATAEVVMLLIDTSGSMSTPVQHGKRAIDALREVVKEIKAAGQVPMIAFGGPYDAQVRFVDEVPEPDGGTPLHLAIPFAKQYGATRLVVVSDGMPDLREQSMMEASAFGGQIDVMFVGNTDEDAWAGGSNFLKELAAATGGQLLTGDFRNVKELTAGVIGLLEGPKDEKAPIQGAGFTTVETDEDEEDETDEDEEDEDDDEE